MQLHIRTLEDNISNLSQKLEPYKSSEYTNDSEFLKLLNFVEWSKRFIAFINMYAKMYFENNSEFSDKCKKDNSEFLDKWKKNNDEGNKRCYKLYQNLFA